MAAGIGRDKLIELTTKLAHYARDDCEIKNTTDRPLAGYLASLRPSEANLTQILILEPAVSLARLRRRLSAALRQVRDRMRTEPEQQNLLT